MQKLNFFIKIKAPRQKVWDVMLADATYRQWTEPFTPGSYFKGEWSKGSKIQFLGPDPKTGKEGGMYAEIAEYRPYEFVSIKHLGEVKEDGTEAPWPNSEQEGFENYTLKEANGTTELLIDLLGVPDEWKQMMNDAWPKALQKLKELSEK